MSLVVARKNESGIILVADTALVKPNDENDPSSLEPQLKVTFPFPDVALAFAGTIHFANKAAEELLVLSPNFDLDHTLEILIAQNIASNNLTDFILAISNENEIYEVKSGRANRVEASWAGDQSAFNKFQESFHALDCNSHLSIRLIDSMKLVIADKSIKNVSGFVVRADNCDSDRKFRYMVATEMYCGNETFTIPAGKPVPIPFGNAASGAHRVDVFPCDGKAGRTLGIFFEVGEFGFIWTTPGRFEAPEKFSKVTRAEFEYQVIQVCNLNPSIGLSWTDYFKSAVKMFKAGNFPLAEKYCNRGIDVQSTREYIPDREDYFRIFQIKAEALAKQYRFSEAEKANEIAIDHSPLNKELHYYSGLIFTDLSNFARAEAAFSKAIEIDPEYAPPYQARGNIKMLWSVDDLGKADLQKYAELANK